MTEHLGRYQILRELGRGGMGVVYKALDPHLERHVAIKCLSDEWSHDEIVVARFLREARNVAALNHPNCVRLYVADEHEGQPFFVMEYVDGESLADYLTKNGRCPPEMAERIIRECAEALAAADEKNIVHRDVKPGNVMLDRSGRALLTDFGIACVQYGEAAAASTVMGTPGYMAPELIENGRGDRRSDIFALGAVWYELLLGRRLVPESDLTQSVKRFSTPGFPDLAEIEHEYGVKTAEILARMLARNPEDRFSTYSELLEALRPGYVTGVEHKLQTAATVVASTQPTDTAKTVATDAGRTTAIGTQRGRSADATRGVPVAGARRFRGLAIAGAVVGGVAILGLAIALTGAEIPSESNDPPADGVDVTAMDPEIADLDPRSVATLNTAISDSPQRVGTTSSATAEPASTISNFAHEHTPPSRSDLANDGLANAVVDSTSGEPFAPDARTAEADGIGTTARSSRPQARDDRVPPPLDPATDQTIAMVRPASSIPAVDPTRVAPTTATRPPAAPTPRRITVLGVGDPIPDIQKLLLSLHNLL
ncbi:MAG: protein kinase domain-containing protein [Wenzhouxiangellaceae bacterium]